MREHEFPNCGFDWYVLEKWDSSDSIQPSDERRRKHVELGKAYAALGHIGRRPYILKAHAWGYGEITTLPRDVVEIPTDLLHPTERVLNRHDMSSDSVWVRTAYGPGTDARWQELVGSYTDGLVPTANDAHRYDRADGDVLFASFPCMLELDACYYSDPDLPDDASQVLQAMYLTDCKDGMAEEHRLTCKQAWLFVADDQAMRTGFIEWRMFDEYGHAHFKELIQPWSLQHVAALRIYNSPEQFRKDIAKGYYGDDPRYSSDVLRSWEPPTEHESGGTLISAAMQNLRVLEAPVSSGRVSISNPSEL